MKKIELQKKILHRLFDGNTTRSELIEQWQLRPGTLLKAVDALKADGLVMEPNRKGKKTGRRASELQLNSEYGCFIGIDLHIHYTAGIIMDLAGNILAETFISSETAKNANIARSEIAECIKRLKSQLGADHPPILGLGFADPGLVDQSSGKSLVAVNLPGWHDFDIRAWLKSHFEIEYVNITTSPTARIFIEASTLEQTARRGIFHMELGTGIGGGFIKSGAVFYGDSGCGMEIGHVIVEPDGPLCQCGNKGCLEVVAGEAGIRRQVNAMLSGEVITSLTKNISIQSFIDCVNSGDKVATTMAFKIADNIGLALVNVVALLNPALIILSGELTGMGSYLTNSIEQTLKMNCHPRALKKMEIKISKLDSYATAKGAAMMNRNALLLNKQ
jgi:N-acetylglucosamine repressor